MNERKDKVADEAFAEKAKQLFDESVEGVQWAPAAGIAAAAVVAVVLWTGSPPVDELTPSASATDFEILLTEESFEMLEDLEFYSWIDLDEDADETVEAEDIVG
jgi:hypothetical protein